MFEITEDSISFQKTIHKVKCRDLGSIITYIGTVREFTKPKKTVYKQYYCDLSFEVSRYVLEHIKRVVSVWKKEI